MGKFAHLHLHTEYSLLDGASRTDKLFAACEEKGIAAVAITDHGNMYGALEFFKAAAKHTDKKADPYDFTKNRRKFKVKPIIGCEVYTVDDISQKTSTTGRMPRFNHLVLLCKNEVGYHNLIKIVSKGFVDGFYYKPRVDFSILQKHSEGLIALSACLSGEVPFRLLRGETALAYEAAKRFKDLFGDDYYIELQDHGLAEQRQVNPLLIKLADELDIKLVCTNDVHYIQKEDAEMQRVLQCISFRTTIDERGDGSDDYFPTNEFYLKSAEEMQQLFSYAPKSIVNTMEIADKCEPYFFKREQLLPKYEPHDGSTPEEFLKRLAYDGCKRLYKTMDEQIQRRLDYELKVISDLGYVEYFLIVWDFIYQATKKGIPVGPGRGSGVGSIVAYSIGITKVDPLKYDLYFERFLNYGRVSSPDFDIDICVERRDEVINYVIGKYGIDNVVQIITFGTLAAKAAIKDVGRVFNYPYADVDKITKSMPTMTPFSIEKMLGIDGVGEGYCAPFAALYNSDSNAKRIIDMAIKIEGLPRHTGMHAAGVVICRDAVDNHIPITKSTEDKITTQFDMNECEQLGLLKMDFLGLNTLTDIDKAIKLIRQTRGVDIDFYNMEYNDPAVFKMLGDGDTHGVFQLESGGMKSFMRELKPTCMEDIIAGISLYRPGPMSNIPVYIQNKRKGKIDYEHPALEPILNVTYGVVVYQEQVMQIVRELAGYSLDRADGVRRLMSKKKAEEMKREREIFLNGLDEPERLNSDGTVSPAVHISGALARGVPKAVAEHIFDTLTSFASYAFNKSHAAAYAYLAYQTAYLKKHFRNEFFTELLNNRLNNIKEITNYLTYLKECGVKILPPCVNNSSVGFKVEGDAVRVGMGAIKNVGAGLIAQIVQEREAHGDYKSFEQFAERLSGIGLNKKNLESMIFAGCFDVFGQFRSQLMASFDTIIDRAEKDKKAALMGQISMFDAFKELETEFKYPNIAEYEFKTKLKYEKEATGVYLTGHILDEYMDALKEFSVNTSMLEINSDGESDPAVCDGAKIRIAGMLTAAARKFTKANKEMGVGRLEDLYGSVEVMLSPTRYQSNAMLFKPDSVVVIDGTLSEKEGAYTVWIEKLMPLSAAKAKSICLLLSFEKTSEKLLDDIQEVLGAHKGANKVYLKNTDNAQVFSLGISAEISDALLLELEALVGGSKNIIIK